MNKISCVYAAGAKENCEVIFGSQFLFSQDGQEISVNNERAKKIVQLLQQIEEESLRWIQDEVAEPSFESSQIAPGLDLTVEPEDTRLAFAIHLQSSQVEVAFDLDSAWLVRVFLEEALKQKESGVYSSWD